MKFRSNQWRAWHHELPAAENVINSNNQETQYLLLKKYINLSQKKAYSIIELGPFNGGLAKHILDNNKISTYTIVDDPLCHELCQSTLKDHSNVSYIAIDNIDSIINSSYDIFISNFCLSETTNEYQNFVINSFFGKCKHIFIYDNFISSGMFSADCDINAYYLQIINTANARYDHVHEELTDINNNTKLIHAHTVKQ